MSHEATQDNLYTRGMAEFVSGLEYDAIPEEVRHRLKLLMLMRVVMVTTLLLVAVYVEAVSENLLPINPLYFLIVCTYGLTVIHAVALRFVDRPVVLVSAQVVGDLLITTGLVYVTGGVRTGFMLLYPISVLSGAVLLYRRAGMVFAGLATLCYAAIVWAVREGWVPPQGLSDVPYLSPKALVYSIFVTAVACTTVALIGSYLSESLKSVGQRLEETAEQVADSILRYYDLGVSSILIRGFEPLEDVREFGRELIPLVRAGAARRDRAGQAAD